MPRRKSNTAKGLRCEEVAMALAGDRRKRKRVLLHWPVRLLRQPGTSPIDTTTENISSEGLYCISNESFKPGERVQCMIVIPAGGFGLERSLNLECQVTVRRVEELPIGFGLGCHIEDYALAT